MRRPTRKSHNRQKGNRNNNAQHHGKSQSGMRKEPMSDFHNTSMLIRILYRQIVRMIKGKAFLFYKPRIPLYKEREPERIIRVPSGYKRIINNA